MASEPTQEQSQDSPPKLPTSKYFIAQCYIKPDSPEHALWSRIKESMSNKKTGEIILIALRLLDKKIDSLKAKKAESAEGNTPQSDFSTTPAEAGGEQ